jgi:dTDP-4-amino-4,6-dideoxygalactose transaminase
LYLNIPDQRKRGTGVTKSGEKKRIYLSSPHMSDEGYEKAFIEEAFATNWIAPLGPNVDAFEKELAEKVGVKAAVALSSGTAAIHLALKAVGVGEGDIVFCQDLTFAATANPIRYQGAIPVFIDSNHTWNMCPLALRKAFEKYEKLRRKPKAVIVVHLYGLSADLDPILEVCREYDVPLIEDAAESLGSCYKGRATGTIGDLGIYSFNGNKIITTSGGGMLVSNDEEKIEKARYWATQSREPFRHYEHRELGYNYRMSNVCAGIGRGQLKVLAERIAKKKYIFEYYRQHLSDLDGLDMMPIQDYDEPNHWLSCVLLSGTVRPIDIIESLEAEGIESRPIWKPMHMQPYYRDCDFITLGEQGSVSDDIFVRGVCLPSDTKMTDGDLVRVVEVIRGLWGWEYV